jgi:CelD/BcsL family acetyltransferase involved in cellulose biosynthesis
LSSSYNVAAIEAAHNEEAAGWAAASTSLRYSLSDLKLFELTFKALIESARFDPDRERVTDVAPPVEEVPEGYDVLVQRHRLLATPIPVVRRLPKLIRYAPRQLLHFYTDLRGGEHQAFKQMSSKTRSTLRRKVRAYQTFCGGELRWNTYKRPEEMITFSRLAKELARRTYQEKLFGGGLPDTENFRQEMLDLARQDSVRAYLLFHGEKPVAYLYLPAADGTLIYDYLGYDPDYLQHSPGTVLQYLVLEELYREQRFPLYYWGFGYSQTKEMFCTGQVLGADIYYFRPTAWNQVAVFLHYATDRFSASAGRRLESLGIKQAIRRWLRTR